MLDQVAPPLRDTSILTLPTSATDVQVMFCVLPIAHLSPRLGAIAVIRPPMAKSASLASAFEGLLNGVTRMRVCSECGPVTGQVNIPSFGVLATMIDHVAPLLRDNSMRTFPPMVSQRQMMFCVLPIGHLSPPLGDMTVHFGLTGETC